MQSVFRYMLSSSHIASLVSSNMTCKSVVPSWKSCESCLPLWECRENQNLTVLTDYSDPDRAPHPPPALLLLSFTPGRLYSCSGTSIPHRHYCCSALLSVGFTPARHLTLPQVCRKPSLASVLLSTHSV